MQLHNIQVTLSSADIAGRYQIQQQHMAAAAQAQDTLNMNSKAEIKKTQTQDLNEEQAAKETTEDEKRMKRWAKGRGGEKKRDEARSGNEEEDRPGQGRIIDIKA